MSINLSVRLFLVAALLCSFGGALPLSAQKPAKAPAAAPDDVVRIDTELIQSPVIVVDKQGHFVSDLSREQFELDINGRPRQISFFEQVAAGSPGEAQKLEAARKGGSSAEKGATSTTAYGRIIVFFIDDLHLNAESVNRTRTAVSNFIERSLGQNDRALVIAASGSIGFLQQLTDNKDVLQAAIGRLKHREYFVPDETRPPMTAYQALAIENGDSGALQYFADQLVKDQFNNLRTDQDSMRGQPGTPQQVADTDRRGESRRNQAEGVAKNRAKNILVRYSSISTATLRNLKQAVTSLAALPGSKLVFFISDGFFINQQGSELEKLNEIASGAMRAGTVVYSVQASGLGNTLPTASADVRLSPRMDTGATMIGQDGALQAPLYTVAVDTGGRALFNSNSMDTSLTTALQETSRYYLLAWRPEIEEKQADVFQKVQVRVKGHPEWTIRMQKGYFLPATAKKSAAPPPVAQSSPAPEISESQRRMEKMRDALTATFPLRDLRMFVTLSFLDQPPGGPVINIGTELSVASTAGDSAGGQPRLIDLVGIVLNDEGKTFSSFSGQLKSEQNSSGGQTVSRLDEIKVKPGLYQVRVAALDQGSGVTGSASDWILVPDLAGGKFALSSLLIGDVSAPAAEKTMDEKAHISVSHQFSRSGRLRFLTHIHNAARGSDGKSAPDITVQLKVMRDDKVLSTSPQIKVPTDGLPDPSRVPYAGELALRLLPAGSYLLSVVATDNRSKSSYTQSVKFVVE